MLIRVNMEVPADSVESEFCIDLTDNKLVILSGDLKPVEAKINEYETMEVSSV